MIERIRERRLAGRRGQRFRPWLTLVASMAMIMGQMAPALAASPPEAYDGFWVTKAGTPVEVYLDAYDGDFDVLTFAIVGGPANGSLDDCSDGLCTYTPDGGFIGSDSFTFTASDGALSSNEATVTIEVNANAAPVAFDGYSSTKVDTPVGVYLGGSDPDGDVITSSVVTPPAHGSLDGCSFNYCTYTPDAGFVGADSLEFTMSDGELTSNVATVSIDVQADLPPEAIDGAAQGKLDQEVTVGLQALDPNGDPIEFSIIDGPDHGTIDDCTYGYCTYTPDAGFTGVDPLTFTASDGINTSAPATFTVEILSTDLRVTPLSGTTTPSDLANALAGVGVTISNVSFTGADAGAGLFTGGSGGIGFESGVVLSSGSAADVVGPNLEDGRTTDLDQPGDPDLTALAGVETLDATILAFDLTPESDQLTFQYVFTSEEYNEFVNSAFNDVFAFFVNGENCAIVNGDPVSINTINNGNPFGSDPRSNSAFYINNDLDDGGGAIDTEMDGLTVVLTCVAAVTAGETNTVRLAIADGSDSVLDSAVFLAQGSFQANTAPVADDIDLTTAADTAIDVMLSGSDAEDDPLTFGVVEAPSNGSLTGLAPNVTYTPNPGFVGVDTFTYIASDGVLDSAPATVTITVEPDTSNEPPVVDAGSAGPGVEGSALGLDGSASDPDGDVLTVEWSYVAGADVDAGATCSFGDVSAVVTSVTCTDDGTYTLSLTVSDGVNPPVSDTVTVSIVNADPTVSITTPAEGSDHEVGSTVEVSAGFADHGSNDTHTCSIDWGDGTVADGVVAAFGCAGSHAYATADQFTVTVTVFDDDGGSGSDSVGLTVFETPVNEPPVVDAGSAGPGVEGSALGLDGSASDPDGDVLTVEWSYVAGADVDAGATCSFGDVSAVVTSVTCTDDGTYTLSLTVSDGVNPPVSDTVTVSIVNADPTVSITTPADGATVNTGGEVTLVATIEDEGSNDAHTCSVDWGDGTVDTGSVQGATCTASHSYGAIAVPTIMVTVTDDDGGSGTDDIMLVVTSEMAKVTGGGWLLDATGARVNVGLVAEIHGGVNEGQLQARIHNAHRFHGTTVDVISVTGSSATWSGTGRWDGVDGFGYMVTVQDLGNGNSKKGKRDVLTLEVFDSDGILVYRVSGPLGGGNLKVH